MHLLVCTHLLCHADLHTACYVALVLADASFDHRNVAIAFKYDPARGSDVTVVLCQRKWC